MYSGLLLRKIRYNFDDRLVDDSKTVLRSLQDTYNYKVENEEDDDFGLAVLEISEDTDDQPDKDNIIVIN